MSDGILSIKPCTHSTTDHLFQPFDCKTIALVKKIAIIAFHILTLGIPLAIYNVIKCCFPKKAVTEDVSGKKLQQQAVASISKTAVEEALDAWKKFKSSQTDEDLFSAFKLMAKATLPSENALVKSVGHVTQKLMKDDKFELHFSEAASGIDNHQIGRILPLIMQMDISLPELSKNCVLLMRMILKNCPENRAGIARSLYRQLEKHNKNIPDFIEHLMLCDDSSDGVWRKAISELTVVYLMLIPLKQDVSEQQQMKKDIRLKDAVQIVLADESYKEKLADFEQIKVLSQTPQKTKTAEDKKEPTPIKPSDVVKAAGAMPVPKTSPVDDAEAFSKLKADELRQSSASTLTLTTGVVRNYVPHVTDVSYIVQAARNHEKEFDRVLKSKGKAAWSSPEVINAADELMKISYVAACRVLEDMDNFIATLKKENPMAIAGVKSMSDLAERMKNPDASLALDLVNGGQFFAFDLFTYTYHSIRAGKCWSAIQSHPDGEEAYVQECWRYPAANKAEDFYKEGTFQNRWRTLYNDYCKRFEKAVKLANNAFYSHRISQDENSKFEPFPQLHLQRIEDDVNLFMKTPIKQEIDGFERQAAAMVKKTTAQPDSINGKLELHFYGDMKDRGDITEGFKRVF